MKSRCFWQMLFFALLISIFLSGQNLFASRIAVLGFGLPKDFVIRQEPRFSQASNELAEFNDQRKTSFPSGLLSGYAQARLIQTSA